MSSLAALGGSQFRESLSLFNSHPLSLCFFSLSFAIAVFEWNFPFKKKRECRKALHCADDKFLESLLIMKFCVSGAQKCLYVLFRRLPLLCVFPFPLLFLSSPSVSPAPLPSGPQLEKRGEGRGEMSKCFLSSLLPCPTPGEREQEHTLLTGLRL